MSEALLDETAILLSRARNQFAGRPSRNTLIRWWRTGLPNPNGGERITLETFLDGGNRYTTEEACRRFRQRINGYEIGD